MGLILVRPIRAVLPLLFVCTFGLRASQPDLIDWYIRGVLDKNAKTNGMCQVHHVQMERRLVPVAFGLPPPPSEAYDEAMQRDFPHSSLHIEGGCVTSEKFRHARLPWYVCPTCKRAEHEWAEKHRDTPEGKAILSGKDARRPDLSASHVHGSNQAMKRIATRKEVTFL